MGGHTRIGHIPKTGFQILKRLSDIHRSLLTQTHYPQYRAHGPLAARQNDPDDHHFNLIPYSC